MLLSTLRVVKGTAVVAAEMWVYEGMRVIDPVKPVEQEVVQGFLWFEGEQVFGEYVHTIAEDEAEWEAFARGLYQLRHTLNCCTRFPFILSLGLHL